MVQPLHSVSDDNFMDTMLARAEEKKKTDEINDEAQKEKDYLLIET